MFRRLVGGGQDGDAKGYMPLSRRQVERMVNVDTDRDSGGASRSSTAGSRRSSGRGSSRPTLLDERFWSRSQRSPSPSPETPSANEIVQWLLEADEKWTVQLLTEFAHARPSVLRQAMQAAMTGHVTFNSPRFEPADTYPEFDLPDANVSEFRVSPTAQVELSVMPAAQSTADLGHDVSSASVPVSQALRRVVLDSGIESRAGLPLDEDEDEEIFFAPVVQFSAFEYYCQEDEGVVTMDIIRIGDLSRPTEVSYCTRDASAQAGVTYESAEGRVRFEAEEAEKQIQVSIIERDRWDTTLEFTVELAHDTATNATLGQYAWEACIRLIDNDCFPTNRFREEIEGQQLTNVPKMSLLLEYFKLNWENDRIRWRSWMILLIDAMHNCYVLLRLFMNVYMVDFVLSHRKPDGRLIFIHSKEMSLMLLIGANLVPFAVLHVLDNIKTKFCGVGGPARTMLQVALVRKFLNYSEESRSDLQGGKYGDMITSMVHDAARLVRDGYENSLKLSKEVGSFIIVLIYEFVAPKVFEKPRSILGLVPIAIFPVAIFVLFQCRQRSTSRVLIHRHDAFDQVVEKADETLKHFRLISAYNRRLAAVESFAGVVHNYNESSRKTNLVLMNNEYFVLWLLNIVVATWTLLGGMQVINRGVPLGIFLTDIHILNQVGHSWINIYNTLLEMNTIFPALERIVSLMNLPTDVHTRKRLSRLLRSETESLMETMSERRQITEELAVGKASADAAAALRLQQQRLEPVVDQMPIFVGDLRFKYVTKSRISRVSTLEIEKEKLLNLSGRLEIQQGQLACLMGPKGGGKTTLLKILGGEILPRPVDLWGDGEPEEKSPHLFVPSHLRVLYTSEPLFIQGSLRENLIFGIHPDSSDGRPSRVLSILRLVGASKDVLWHLEREDICDWAKVLSQTQCQLISLSRALIANPELLCLHRPAAVFSASTAKHIFHVLREFVGGRGLHQDAARKHIRRPRTCVFTSATMHESIWEVVDSLFYVSEEEGIRKIGTLGDRRKFNQANNSPNAADLESATSPTMGPFPAPSPPPT